MITLAFPCNFGRLLAPGRQLERERMLRDVAARWKLAAKVAANRPLQSKTRPHCGPCATAPGHPGVAGGLKAGRRHLPQASLEGLAEFSARWDLHLERRSFARRRHHPDAAAVHFDDLLGDGEPEARAALGLGKGAVNLVELIENPILLVERYAGSGVCYRDGEMAVPRARGDAHLAGVGELDGVADEVEQHLREALFVSEANGKRLVHGRREREHLILGERLGGRAHR